MGEANFHTQENPRSGSKAEDGEKKKKKEERGAKVGDNNVQATHGVRKPPGPKEDRKLVITMASYTLQQHLGWRTQSHLSP